MHFDNCGQGERDALTYSGFKKYKAGETELQPGDVLIYQPGAPHTDIYAGDGKKLNAGHDITSHYDNFVGSCSNWSTYDIYRLENNTKNSSSSSNSSFATLIGKGNITQKTLDDKGCKQLVIVNSSGSTAKVTYYEKISSGWKQDSSLTCDGYVGGNGVGTAYEGSSTTPKGLHGIGEAFYGLSNSKPSTGLDIFYTKNQYWIDDPNSSKYNTRVTGKPSCSAEDMDDSAYGAYKYGFVIKYNEKGEKYTSGNLKGKGKGSAFFFHVTTGRPTAGCVAVSESMVCNYLSKLNKSKKPYILII